MKYAISFDDAASIQESISLFALPSTLDSAQIRETVKFLLMQKGIATTDERIAVFTHAVIRQKPLDVIKKAMEDAALFN